MGLSSSPTQIILTAFTFGLASIVIATLPFIFTILNGSMKAKNGNTPSSSVISVFCLAFFIHTICCILFILGIKLLDILNSLESNNFFANKIFPIFWARGENAVFNLAGGSGSFDEKGAYLQLFLVQTITDWLIVAMPLIVFMVSSVYGAIQSRKDTANTDLVNLFVWIFISNIVGFFAFFAWAKIASLALFIPENGDLITKIFETYEKIITIESGSK